MNLEGMVALVAGGTSGIGRAITAGFVALASDEPGLYAFELTASGLDLSRRVAPLERVHALVADRERGSLFAGCSAPSDPEAESGLIVRYAFRDAQPGELVRLAEAPSGGTTPCRLALVADRFLVANFRAFGAPGQPGATSRGSVGAIGIDGDGGLALEHSLRFPGSSTHPQRQTCSHPHYVLPSLDDSVLVADLGTDRIWRCRMGPVPSYECAVELPPGSGPRHIAVAPDGQRLYVVNEIANTVTTCIVARDGEVRIVAETPILPDPTCGGSAAGDVAVSADGTMILATNRGQNSVVLVGADTGRPTVLDHLHLDAAPGDFALAPTGDLLVPVGEDLVVCRVVESNKTLSRVGSHRLPGRITALCVLR